MTQIVTTLKNYEYEVKFCGCSFFIMNMKIQLRIHRQNYIMASQASNGIIYFLNIHIFIDVNARILTIHAHCL